LATGLLVNFLSDLNELTLGLSSPFSEVVHLAALRSIPPGEILLTDPNEQRRLAPDGISRQDLIKINSLNRSNNK
jgi:hypothetical protein